MTNVERRFSPNEENIERIESMSELDRVVEFGLLTFGSQVSNRSFEDNALRIRSVHLRMGMYESVHGELEKVGLFNWKKAREALYSIYNGGVIFDDDYIGLEMNCEPRNGAPIDESAMERKIIAYVSFHLEDPTRISYTDEGYECHPIIDWARYNIEIPTQQNRDGKMMPATSWFFILKREDRDVDMLFERYMNFDEIEKIKEIVSKGISNIARDEEDYVTHLREELKQPSSRKFYEEHYPMILDEYGLR